MTIQTCFYKHTGVANITRSGCLPSRDWIPQLDMNYCPFCGHPLKILRIASVQELPKPPPLKAS
jgi:hypothetical protein